MEENFLRAGEALKLPFYLEEMLIQVQGKVNCEAGSILLYDNGKKKLVFKVTTGPSSSEIKKLSVGLNEGLAGWVFKHKKPIIVNDTEKNGRFSKRFDNTTGFKTKSLLAVPLEVGDNVVGVMQLLNKINDDFTQNDLNIVLSSIPIVSVLIENVELYKHLRKLVNKLKDLENYQKVLLENLTDGVMSIDAQNKIVSCNRVINLIMGVDSNSMIGKDISQFFESKNIVNEIICRCHEKGKVNEFFCYLKQDNERIPVAIDASSFDYENDKGIVIVVRNLSKELNQAEMKREILLRSDLVSNLSHEFNTPLTAIQAGIQILKENFSANGGSKFLEIVENNVNILKERVQSFIDYLKAEKDEWKTNPEKIELSSLLSQTIGNLKMKCPQYKFSISLPKSSVNIYADREQIKKVLEMIYKNAIQYSNNGSVIETKVVVDNRFIYLYIKDQGKGIPSEDIKYLFSKFKRFTVSLKETSSGLGIGLWLTKYLLSKNNAEIKIKSKVGEGTTVKISFKSNAVDSK